MADSISTIASIPRATGETRALNFNGQMLVMGGGRTAPNPSNEVDVYDPVTALGTTGLPFTTARRNFPTDTDGTTRIWLAGGYDGTGVPVSSMETLLRAGPTPTQQRQRNSNADANPNSNPHAYTNADQHQPQRQHLLPDRRRLETFRLDYK